MTYQIDYYTVKKCMFSVGIDVSITPATLSNRKLAFMRLSLKLGSILANESTIPTDLYNFKGQMRFYLFNVLSNPLLYRQ